MIKLFEPEINSKDLRTATNCVIKSQVYTKGEIVKGFEKELEKILVRKNVIATSSGTTALHLAVRALGWSTNDKIITSQYSYIATSNCLLYERCQPIFCGIDENFQLNLKQAFQLLIKDDSIKGLVVPYIFGSGANVADLKSIRKNFPHIKIIEDASQAFAPNSYNLNIGKYSDITTYSFHENKIITTAGEGGAVATNSTTLAKKIMSMREQGRIDSRDWINKIKLGFNYRMTEIQAATGLIQLGRINDILIKRNFLANLYNEKLKNLPIKIPSDINRSWFVYFIELDSEKKAGKLCKDLLADGIEARGTPIRALSDFSFNKQYINYGNAQTKAKRTVLLPLHCQLTAQDVRYICKCISSSLAGTSVETMPSKKFYDAIASKYQEELNRRQDYISAIDKLVIEKVLSLNHRKVIDIGCGDGTRSLNFSKIPNINLLCVDSSDEMVLLAKAKGLDTNRVDISGKISIKDSGKYNVSLLLWNVLGHIPNANRVKALKNVFNILDKNGYLILDVNNMLNSANYGVKNVKKNQIDLTNNFKLSNGDFTINRSINQNVFRTSTHIFYTKEIIDNLAAAGFQAETIKYISYKTGEEVDEYGGQIFIIAQKVIEK